MKVYEAVLTDEELHGIELMSVVNDPAMQDIWVQLADHPQEIQFQAIDDEKRLLLGAALIPDKKIYRNLDGNEFYVYFKADTIEKVAHDFFKKGNNNNTNLEHELELSGMSVVQSWIVDDPKTDKSNLYGKEYEKGTWVIMMKVDNDQMWEKAKKGEINGFSVHGYLGLRESELKLNSNINMTKQDFLDAFKAIFSKEEEAEKIETQATEVSEEIAEAVETAEVVDKSTEAMKEAVSEVLAQFSKTQDEKFETFKTEMSTSLQEKEEELKAVKEENENLKLELNKQPEVEAVKVAPKETMETTKVKDVGIPTTSSRVFNNLAEFWN